MSIWKFSWKRERVAAINKEIDLANWHARSIFRKSEQTNCDDHNDQNCAVCSGLGFSFRHRVQVQLTKLYIAASDEVYP